MPGIFISYRRTDAAAVAGRLFDHLSRHFGRKNVFRDIDAIEPGAEFVQVIAERIGACDALIAIIGKDWLDARDAQGQRRLDQPHDLVAAEISEALAQHKLVIPALIEGASMPVTEALPPGIASLAHRNAILISDTRFDYDVSRLIAALEKVIGRHTSAQEQPRLSGRELQNRRDLLDDVRREVADRLTRSLHNPVMINLLKEKKYQQVKQAWDADIKIGRQLSTPLPPETGIVDVFDEDAIAGKLLILGAPGAGKTTALLQLAKVLSARAERDLRVPMPVLLNLSSWRESYKILPAWIEGELKVKYGVQKDLGRRWLAERGLLLLLDGLDELEPTGQEGCVQAINEFQELYRPQSLVVCCRQAEYQNLNTKLNLNGAISLQPLTNDQIRDHLASVEFSDLWKSIEADPELLELARSPLLLSMMMLVYEGKSIEEWQEVGSTLVRRRYLFNLYIERMLSRERKSETYREEKTLRWLTWLARRLKEQGQPEFLIEKLQPTWLQSLTQKWLYRLTVLMIVGVIFGLYKLLEMLLLEFIPSGGFFAALTDFAQKESGGHGSQVSLGFTVIMGLIAGFVIALMQNIRPIETLRWSATRARNGLVLGLRRWSMVGLKYGAVVGLVVGSIQGLILAASLNGPWNKLGEIIGVIPGLIAGVLTLRVAMSSDWRTRRLHRDWLAVGAVDALISGLLVGLSIITGVDWPNGLSFGVAAGLSVAIFVKLRHQMNNPPLFRMTDALLVGLIGWLISMLLDWLAGAISTPDVLGKGSFGGRMQIWLHAWLGMATTAGFVAALITRPSGKSKPVSTEQWAPTEVGRLLALKWRRWLIVGVIAGSIWGLIAWVLIGLDQLRIFILIGASLAYMGLALFAVLSFSVVGVLGGSALGAVSVAILGGLIGALKQGLTGPDIERRTVPNQGIRQSAVNVGLFALIGGLSLGAVWGMLNGVAAVALVGVAPLGWEWLGIVLIYVLFFAFLSALVPGAACIQHFALRFILWCRGVAPWNYARFLNYATERMLLQRVGGRYWFMHDLLRDHFAVIEPKR
jgi:hypothetical protein